MKSPKSDLLSERGLVCWPGDGGWEEARWRLRSLHYGNGANVLQPGA